MIEQFVGNRTGAINFLKTIPSQFYVYVLCRPNGKPFYVGKGLTAERWSTKRKLAALTHQGRAIL